MNKVQLIQALKDATDLTKSEAAAVADIFFNGMADKQSYVGYIDRLARTLNSEHALLNTCGYPSNFGLSKKGQPTNVGAAITIILGAP